MEIESIKVTSSNQDETQKAFEDSKPGLNIFIEENFANIFTSSETFIDIKFDGALEPLSAKNVLTILKHFSDREFVLRVCSLNSNSFAYYWRAKDTTCVSSAECEKEDICEFLKEFLNVEIQNGKSGVLSGYKSDYKQLVNSIELCLMGDERGFNLLFLASEAGNAKVVQSLLEDGMNVSCLVDGKIPADIAYERKHLDVLLCLLMANSRFPRNFEMQEEANDCNSILQISLNLRQAVLNDNNLLVKQILNSNKNLRYFYDTNNESILTYALVNKKFEMYELLMSFHLSFGPREDFDEILQYLDADEERKLRTLHQGSSQKVVEKHLMILMSNSFVAHDNFEARGKLCYIYDAYEYLNDIPVAKPILKAIAARRDFEIHFDFNRDTTVYLDPSLSGANGLFYLCGRILISAKGLLDPDERDEVYGVMIHELGHFAMTLVYENDARPYFRGDSEEEQRFEAVSAFCKARMEVEPMIQSVYEDYEEDDFHPELIVRSPQLIAQYYENNERLDLIRETFAPLHQYFEQQVVPDVESAIPRIEFKADEAYNKALKKISRLQKALWFMGIFSIVFCTALALFLYDPVYSWNGLNPVEKAKILNSTVSFKGIDITLKNLMANESEGFQHLKSGQIKHALNGDTKSLSEALNSVLDQYIYLSPSNLTDSFWDKIKDSDVSFQGHNITLREIALNNSSLEKLSSNQIKSLLSNQPISIGNKIEFTSFYIPRKFIKNEDLPLNSSLEVFNYANESKIFLLSGKPGSGKSISFQALRSELKQIAPDCWIELVELKKFATVFTSIQNNSVDIISDQILELEGLERDLFVDRFENEKVILLWDAVDEIAPQYDDSFLSLAADIFQNSDNIQFISSRPQNVDKLKKIFNIGSHSLLEYSEKDRINFIKGYLDSNQMLNETFRAKIHDQVLNFTRKLLLKASFEQPQDINNPLMLKILVDIAISEKLSEDLDDIYEIYDTFINLKLDVISTKGENVVNIVVKSLRDVPIDVIHTIYALKYIFGDSFYNHLNKSEVRTDTLWTVKKIDNFSDNQLSSYGIMTRSNNKTDFVHRTFAEFFIAKYLITNIYEFDHLKPTAWSSPIALLYDVAYNTNIRKVIIDFILSYLKTQETDKNKTFDRPIIEALTFETFKDYFSIQSEAPLFNKFFEKDERVMKILAKVDQYSNINDWLDEVLGISLGNKKSFIENNQLGLILMRSWQFERKDNKIFADFIRKSTKIFDRDESVQKSVNASTYRNITELSIKLSHLKSISEFFNVSSELLSSEEYKQVFINSVHIIDNDFKDEVESRFYFDKLKTTLTKYERKIALTKFDKDNETLFFKSVKIESEELNEIVLKIIKQTLVASEIYEIFTNPGTVHHENLLMDAARDQDYPFFSKLIKFTQNHTTQDQFRSILLQTDAENDTMLQWATQFQYPDNFLFLFDIYKETLADEEIQNTFLNRKKYKLPSFADAFVASNDQLLIAIAKVLSELFKSNHEQFLKLLSRRNLNGDTFFSLYKNNTLYEKKLAPYIRIVNDILRNEKEREKIVQNLFETCNAEM